MESFVALVLSYLLFLAIGVSALPLCYFIFPNIKKDGFLFAKILGLLLLGVLVWWLSAIKVVPFTRFSVFFTLLFIATASWSITIWKFWEKFRNEIVKAWKLIIIAEIIFLVSFFLFALLKSYHPDIFGAEKYMDLAFMNTCYRGDVALPIDPWLSGEMINYHFGGHFIMSVWAKLIGIHPRYSYNISLCLLFALTMLSSFSFARALTRNTKYALIAPITVTVMGNLSGFLQFIRNWNFRGYSLWKSSRIIFDTTYYGNINEYPFFSFVWSDLHAHVITIPFVILFLAVLLNVLKGRSKLLAYSKSNFFTLAISLGAISFINLFNLPAYTLLIMLSLFLVLWLFREKISYKNWICVVLFILGIIIVVRYTIFFPFFSKFKAPIKSGGIIGITEFKSKLIPYLNIFGLHLFLMTSFLVLEFKKIYFQLSKKRKIFVLGSIVMIFILGAVLTGYYVVGILLGLLLLNIVVLIKNRNKKIYQFVNILIMISLIFLLGCEFFYIKDAYGRALQRMNTVFKFHYQVWILLGLCMPYFIYYFLKNVNIYPRIVKTILGISSLLILLCLFNPLSAIVNKFQTKPSWRGITLDGYSYLKKYHFDDYAGINWLNNNVKGSSVILEATGKSYSYYGRVSVNTGLATVLGWHGHERVWRAKSFKDRSKDVHDIYSTLSNEVAMRLLKKYNVEYIYVGEIENKIFSKKALNKFNNSNYEVFHPTKSISIFKMRNEILGEL